MARHDAKLGIFYLCLGVLVFSLQDAIVKQVSGAYPLTQVVFLRSCVSVPLLWWLVQREEGWRAIVASPLASMAMRALIMLGAYTAYYMAFPAMPLADAVALYFTVPLFVTALAGPFLGERSGWRVWAAVLLGFAGVMVMLQPGSGVFEPAALLSLLSAALYGTAMLLARKWGGSVSGAVIALFQHLVFLLGSGAAALVFRALHLENATHPSVEFLVRPWAAVAPWDAVLMAVCGVVSAVGTVLLTNAYRVARAATVTPFEYTGMLWAPMWGFLFFSEVPRATTVAGAVVIVVAGLLALRAGRATP